MKVVGVSELRVAWWALGGLLLLAYWGPAMVPWIVLCVVVWSPGAAVLWSTTLSARVAGTLLDAMRGFEVRVACIVLGAWLISISMWMPR